MPLALASLLFSWEPGRYLPNSPFEQPHTVICLLSTFWLALYKHFPSARRQPPTSACLPACWPPLPRLQLEERLANNSHFGAQCSPRLPVLSGGRLHAWLLLQWATLEQPVKSAFAPEKYWSALLQMVGESIAPVIKDKSQPNPMELVAA